MPGTVSEELMRILRAKRMNGEESVWLGPENKKVLGHLPPASPAVQTSAPKPRAVPETLAPKPRAVSETLVSAPTLSPQMMKPNIASMPSSINSASLTLDPAALAARSGVENANRHTAPANCADYEKLQSLTFADLEMVVKTCKKCPLSDGEKAPVFGEGVIVSRVMFIGGQASCGDAATEAETMLTNMIKAMGLERGGRDPKTAAYRTNIVKCAMVKNGMPSAEEANCCIGYLHRQIELIKPEIIVLLGAVPLRYLMGVIGIRKMRGKWMDFHGIPVMPTYESEYILRYKQQKRQFVECKRKVWGDLQLVMARLK